MSARSCDSEQRSHVLPIDSRMRKVVLGTGQFIHRAHDDEVTRLALICEPGSHFRERRLNFWVASERTYSGSDIRGKEDSRD